MPNVTFNFRAQGAESVRREIQRTPMPPNKGCARCRVSRSKRRNALQRRSSKRPRRRSRSQRSAQKRSRKKRRPSQRRNAQRPPRLQSEEAKRSSAHATGIRARIRGVMEYVRAAVSGEQQVSREQQREAAQTRERVGSARLLCGHGAIGVRSTLHSQIQDAQQRRATSERNAEIAFRGGGQRFQRRVIV